MVRTFKCLFLGAALCAVGLPSASGQQAKPADKPEVKGGIEGKVKAVDADKETLTIVTSDGRSRSFQITDDTTILGPRGGVVRRRLKDPRFHEGLAITVVAKGTTATELHLGYDRDDAEPDAKPAAPAKDAKAGANEPKPAPAAKDAKAADAKAKDAPKAKPDDKAKDAAKAKPAAKDDEEDDEEFPGKVKSVDPARRLLVVSMLNGKDRSFLLSRDVKVTVKGTASKQGLEDPAIKAGTPVTVVTEPGGRKVVEVKVAPPPAAKPKK
jgi:hypothetical protein